MQDFNRRYYESRVWENTYYRGIPIAKNPCDLWVYQEIIWDTRPNVIIECGTGSGGSTMYLADTLVSLLITPRLVITIDLNRNFISHPNVVQLTGSSINKDIIEAVKESILDTDRVMVVLDSSHEYDHVLSEMKEYGQLVTPGCYMVVEDTNNIYYREGKGAKEAVEDYLVGNSIFEVDENREKFILTFNPGGYLRRKK